MDKKFIFGGVILAFVLVGAWFLFFGPGANTGQFTKKAAMGAAATANYVTFTGLPAGSVVTAPSGNEAPQTFDLTLISGLYSGHQTGPVKSLSLTMEYDPAVFKLADVTSNLAGTQNNVFFNVNNGVAKISVQNPSGQSGQSNVTFGNTMLNFKFEVVGAAGTYSYVNITDLVITNISKDNKVNVMFDLVGSQGDVLSEKIQVWAPCMDSDGGNVTDVKGTVVSQRGTFTDYCVRTYLVEYYCLAINGSDMSKWVNTPADSKCVDGALVPIAKTCVDSDGGIDENVSGTVTTNGPAGEKAFVDECLDANVLREYRCQAANSDVEVVSQVNCAAAGSRCIIGKCAKTSCGDMNNDGDVNVFDLTLIERAVAGDNFAGAPFEVTVENADVNLNSRINAEDTALFSQYLVGLWSFPLGCFAGDIEYIDVDIVPTTLDMDKDGTAQPVIRVNTPGGNYLSYLDSQNVTRLTNNLWVNVSELRWRGVDNRWYYKSGESYVRVSGAIPYLDYSKAPYVMLSPTKKVYMFYNNSTPAHLIYDSSYILGNFTLTEPLVLENPENITMEYNGSAASGVGQFESLDNDGADKGYYVYYNNTAGVSNFIARESGDPLSRKYVTSWGTEVDSAGHFLVSLRIPVSNLNAEAGPVVEEEEVPCPVFAPPFCPDGELIAQDGVDVDGCPLPPTCCGDDVCSGAETLDNCPNDCEESAVLVNCTGDEIQLTSGEPQLNIENFYISLRAVYPADNSFKVQITIANGPTVETKYVLVGSTETIAGIKIGVTAAALTDPNTNAGTATIVVCS